MSFDPVIKLERVGKAYPLFSSPVDRLKQMLMGNGRKLYREHWALQPTDLEVYPGETFGILGRNGSGKSTMLQMICGNLAPSTGRLTVRGKVAALLELGAGFNPDFSGRENVYVNGALAGYSTDEIDHRLERILSFADIGDFVDQPVKTYSTGMYVRLAFACAINVDPNILVVDEALSVGDARFQLKCMRRLEELKENGTTILFVSHATELVKSFCNRALVLDRGETCYIGDAKSAAVRYFQILFPKDTDLNEASFEVSPKKSNDSFDDNSVLSFESADSVFEVCPEQYAVEKFGVGGALVKSIAIQGLSIPNIMVGGTDVSVLAEFSWDKGIVSELIYADNYESNITIGISVANAQGTYLFGGNGFDSGLKIDPQIEGNAIVRFKFKVPHLFEGTYFMTVAVALGNQANHVQLRWYDCFIELKCQQVKKNVYGVFGIDYSLDRIG